MTSLDRGRVRDLLSHLGASLSLRARYIQQFLRGVRHQRELTSSGDMTSYHRTSRTFSRELRWVSYVLLRVSVIYPYEYMTSSPGSVYLDRLRGYNAWVTYSPARHMSWYSYFFVMSDSLSWVNRQDTMGDSRLYAWADSVLRINNSFALLIFSISSFFRLERIYGVRHLRNMSWWRSTKSQYRYVMGQVFSFTEYWHHRQ
jgi:hypothetical protein